MAAGGFFALDRASGAGYSVSRTEGTRVPEKYVLPIVMLVAWPLHVAFVRVAIEGVLRAAMSKTMIRKQRKAHPGFWNWLTYRGIASAITLPIRIWYYCELLKYPIAALAFYVLMWLLGVPLNPLRKWPAIILISSELILVAYYVFFTAQGAGQRIAACPRGRSSTFPPTTATTESRGDDMHGKQSSKNRLKKRLLKRRQAMAKRWDKQSTRRHLPVYLLLLCKT